MTLHSEKKERELIKKLEEISFKPFSARLEELNIFEENTLVSRINSPSLHALHTQIIQKLSPLIDWKHTTPLPEAFKDRKEVYTRYGSAFCAEFYQPHISICRLHTPPPTNPFLDYTWNVETFSLSKKDTSWKEVKTFSLK